MNNLPYGWFRWQLCKQRSQWCKLNWWIRGLHMQMQVLFKPRISRRFKLYSNQTSMYLCSQHIPTTHLLPPPTLWTWTTSTLVLASKWRQHLHHRACSLFKTPGCLIMRKMLKNTFIVNEFPFFSSSFITSFIPYNIIHKDNVYISHRFPLFKPLDGM